jgi:transcriptional antiterminator NusG
VGPGSKPVPLTEEEMRPLGINSAGRNTVICDYKVGDSVTVISGVWENTVGMIKSINEGKHILTINVDMFGRETPVELSFTEVKKL